MKYNVDIIVNKYFMYYQYWYTSSIDVSMVDCAADRPLCLLYVNIPGISFLISTLFISRYTHPMTNVSVIKLVLVSS